jgi:hypothetical protein
MYAICPAHLILVYLIVVIILHAKYKLWSSTLCNLLQPQICNTVTENLIFLQEYIKLMLC